MSDGSPVTGGCLCGSVRYQAEVYLDNAYYCHCRICQRSSGAPAEIAVFIKPGTLKFTKGEPKYYKSSPFAQRGFCPNCGSRLIWRSTEHPDKDGLTVGSLDHPEKVVPVEHICVESQLPWYRVHDDLPRKRIEEIPELVAAWENADLSHHGETRT